MPRTRGQEVALQEQGLPTTPPQQLPTPRRAPKPKGGNRKTRQPVAAPSNIASPPQVKSHATRAKNTTASEPETKALKPVRTAVQKRGRQTKPQSSKVAHSTDEEIVSEEVQETKVLQELSENSNSQVVTPAPREKPDISSIIPISHFPTVIAQTSPSLSGTTQPHENIKRSSKGETEIDTSLSSEKSATHLEPGLLTTDSILLPSEYAQERKLMEIIHDSIPTVIALLQAHPEIKSNASLERLLTERGLSVTMKPLDTTKTRLETRPEEQTLLISNIATESPRQTPQSDGRYLLKRKTGESDQGDIENPTPKRQRTSSVQTQRVPQLFDENGMLSLTTYKEVPVKEGPSEEEILNTNGQPSRPSASQSRLRRGRSPATPQTRGWALSGFLPSAQTVSRFLPSFSRRTPAVTPLPITPSSSAAETSQTETTPSNQASNEHTTISEPHPVTSSDKKNQLTERRRKSRRHRHPKSKRALKAKSEKEEIQERDEMIAALRAQLDAQSKGQAQQEIAQARSATQIEQATEADKTNPAEKVSPVNEVIDTQALVGSDITKINATKQTPKSILKHKTVSPTVIPNPPGGGFGLVLDFFGQDSDSDDEHSRIADEFESPSGLPSKKIRTSGEPAPLYVGDRFRATPYLGKELALPPFPSEISHSHNTFLDTNLDDEPPIPASTPPNGPTVTIKVPSPSDSDSEWDGTSYVDASDDHSVTPPALTSALTRTNEGTPSSSLKVTAKMSDTNTTSSRYLLPTDNPNVNPEYNFSGSNSKPPSATELLFPSTWHYPPPTLPPTPSIIGSPNLALDKARQSALKHKPQQPSRLRETARFSTSPAGTEIHDKESEAENKVIHRNSTNEVEAEHNVIQRSGSVAASRKPVTNATRHSRNERVNNEARGSPIARDNVFDDAQHSQHLDDRDPYAGRIMRQSPHDPMLLEPEPLPRKQLPGTEQSPGPSGDPSPELIGDQSPELSGEISADTTTSEEGPSDHKLPGFDGYAQVLSLLDPQLSEHIHHEWVNSDNLPEIEYASTSEFQGHAVAKYEENVEQFFQSRKGQLDTISVQKVQMSEALNIPQNIRDKMNVGWQGLDKNAALEKFDTGFEDYLYQPT